MKYLSALLFFSILLLFACQQKKAEEEQKPAEEINSTFDSSALSTTNVEIDENQTFFLKYNFTPGESFKYRMTVISQNEQNIVIDTSMNAIMDQTIIYIINFKTLAMDKDSIAELECNFTSVNLKANVNGTEHSYKSGSQIDSAERAKFAEYEALVNHPFNVRVGKNGELVEIYKVDKIMNRFLELRNLTDSLRTEDKAMFKDDMIQRSIKPLLVQIIRELPEQKVAKDSSWSYKRESMPILIFQVDYSNIYKIENLEMFGNDRIAVVTGFVETKVKGNQTYNERGINYQFDKPITTAGGKIYFNIDKGLVQKSTTQTRMETSYRMEMAAPEGIRKGSAREVTSNTNVLELL